MRNRALALSFVLSFAAVATAEPPPVADAEVRRGIALVDEGEYDSAILALDGAVRRLAADKGHSIQDLAEAYFYLGVAYLGKGYETSAKARFREALQQVRDMSPSPEKFPPRVIELFEKAKEESRAEMPAATSTGTPRSAEPKKGGSGKGLLLVAGAVLVGGGVALAAGSKDSSPAPVTTPLAPIGTVSTTLTLNGQTGGAFSCGGPLFFTLYASNTTPNPVHLNRFNLSFTTDTTPCASHPAFVDGAGINIQDLAAGATNVQLRQVDLSGELCSPPNGSSSGCSWQATVALETAIGSFTTILQFTTTR